MERQVGAEVEHPDVTQILAGTRGRTGLERARVCTPLGDALAVPEGQRRLDPRPVHAVPAPPIGGPDGVHEGSGTLGGGSLTSFTVGDDDDVGDGHLPEQGLTHGALVALDEGDPPFGQVILPEQVGHDPVGRDDRDRRPQAEAMQLTARGQLRRQALARREDLGGRRQEQQDPGPPTGLPECGDGRDGVLADRAGGADVFEIDEFVRQDPTRVQHAAAQPRPVPAADDVVCDRDHVGPIHQRSDQCHLAIHRVDAGDQDDGDERLGHG
ncbi:hypothetical protein [Occultella gossypii]|uniref:hypothetical protein n=1 Tax=Occultella gossypii TaxID=2800820 RepID=UPI001CBB431E|nr:hypothetical protein [Occultella gossypii]